MTTRPRADRVPITNAEVLEWLEGAVVSDVDRADVVERARALGVDGERLRAMTEADVKEDFGMVKWGPRRKLMMRIKEMQEVVVVDEIEEVDDDSDVEVIEVEPAGQQVASILEVDDAVDTRMNAEANCVGSCRWVLEKLGKIMRAHPEALSPALLQARLTELAGLGEAACSLPKMSCVVVGNTGAGKSTLLNALLGESEVLPTNGMRACTAVLIELAFQEDEKQPLYVGEAEFITRAEWDKEEEACFEELTTVDGRAILNVSDAKAHNHGAFSKLYAVYGDNYTHSSVAELDLNGKKIYKAPTVAALRAKLRTFREVTQYLGTTQRVTGTLARGFRRSLERFMDSSNNLTAGACWPLVRKVRAWGKNWSVLKSGAVLIDAPGCADSNSARDVVVKKALKDADSVWIVSNINRAVNDKVAKELLGESFRRTLLMDGAYGRLIFVATQSDVLQRSEVVRALNLKRDATIQACAMARNEYTRTRILDDFYSGLEAMDLAAGDEPRPRSELQAKFDMPVYCVSSVDYQKLAGLREDDGPPQVFAEDASLTELPALARFVHTATLEMRSRKVKLATRQLLSYAESLESLVSAKPTPGQEKLRGACREAYKQAAEPLEKELETALEKFDEEVFKSLEDDVVPRLGAGAATASGSCLATATGWGASQNQGGLHWATYKAHLRRGGSWRIDMNEQLAEPVFRAVATHWEKALVDKSQRGLSTLQTALSSTLLTFHATLEKSLVETAGVEGDRVAAAKSACSGSAKTTAAAALAAAKDQIQNKQKDISRAITPMVAAGMAPAFERGFNEKGIGSHRRRCAIVESHVGNESSSLFENAVEPVVAGLAKLRGEVKSLLTRSCTAKLLTDLELSYSVLWEPVSATALQSRQRMIQPVNVAVCEVRSALNKLQAAEGEEAANNAEDDNDDDDDVMDVTAAAAKAKQIDIVEINSDDDDDENMQALPAQPLPAATGVKPERS